MGDTLKNGLKVAASIAGSPLAGTVVDGIFSLFGKKKDTDNSAKLQQQAFDFQREMNKLQMEYNSAEAQKTRDFNSAEASIQRDWEQAMYEQQRDDNQEWNDVGNQLKRSMAAGINPLAFEQGTMSLANPGTGAAANGGSPASAHLNGAPSLMNPSNFGSLDLDLGDALLKKAQIKNLEADTRSKHGEEDRAEEKHGYEISTMKGNLYLQGLKGQLTEQEIEQAKINLDKSLSEINYINNTINSVILDNEIRKKTLATWDRNFEANIKNVEAETGYKISLTDKTRAEIGKVLAETTSISQSNVINSVEFEFVKNNKSALVELRYNKEKQEYDVFCADMEVSKAKNEREYKYQSGTWTGNEYLDGPLKGLTMGLDALSRSLGIGFSINANNPTSRKK